MSRAIDCLSANSWVKLRSSLDPTRAHKIETVVVVESPDNAKKNLKSHLDASPGMADRHHWRLNRPEVTIGARSIKHRTLSPPRNCPRVTTSPKLQYQGRYICVETRNHGTSCARRVPRSISPLNKDSMQVGPCSVHSRYTSQSIRRLWSCL